ncbi:hypothetical protein sce4804 [Sorangium cellulosum So ce56]|uniref:Uncharacterized protein n=1 Tax=Sorangium cellulosum (strain So ce56) TaxID=448385 RepID=A9FF95_SORC5|nr:hypothetical protein [Sorangium cellulosum]CAN94967.1 hypothetical protein sce4804 [Sorangium cellulosum So ce56]
MKSAGYVVLFAIAGCSQGVCRSIGSAPGTAPNPGAATEEPVTAALVNSGEQEVLDEEITPLRKGGRHLIAEPPDDAEEVTYAAWIAAAGLAAQNRQPPPAAPPGFALRAVHGRDLWVLSEDGTRRRGAAAVVLRVGAAVPLIVEAPHTFFDRGTLPVALAIFEAQRARALIVNTSHRYGGGPNPRDASADEDGAEGGPPNLGAAVGGGRNPGHTADGDESTEGAGGENGGDEAVNGNTAQDGAQGTGGGARGDNRASRERLIASLAFADVAHAERSFFLSVHRALLQSFPGTPTVQLHGFQDRSAPNAAIIASAVGHGAALDRLLAPLRAVINEGKVLAYPTEIDRLGGATNVQARWSRQMGAPFYHVEMSRTLRDKLIVDTDFRRRFAAAFSGLTGGTNRMRDPG